ncbi:MAG: MBL fold metallo-hydrolase, partial [Quisquiliibacterium sp.]
TGRTLRRLSAFADVQSVLAACADEKPLWVSSPRGAKLRGDIERFSEHEPAYGELELVVPDGQILHALDWRHDTVVPLLRHVHRLTAPNPSYMTGPGTNTYIIGEPGNWAVIDPGPDDEQHVARIASFVGDGLKYILCTHAHLDHAPGAVILKRLTNAPILTAPAGTNSRSDWKFDPDRTLNHGDKLVLGDTTLRAIHTPGHASNHLCFLLEEDALLLSGDHINNGSTVVIDPPDGNMSDYLRALHDLLAEKIDFILPAHGYVLGPANVAIRHLIAHRLTREAKVLGAVRRAGKAGLDKLLPLVYDDVRPELHRVASRSLLAHLQKLSEDGLVTELSDQWQAA